MPIDVDEIRTGDRVTIYTPAVNDAHRSYAGQYRTGLVGTCPLPHNRELWGLDPDDLGVLARGGAWFELGADDLRIVSHTPAAEVNPPLVDCSADSELWWRDALVVRDRDGDLYISAGEPGRYWIQGSERGGRPFSASLMDADYGPISVVIDADGRNVEAEQAEWAGAVKEANAMAEGVALLEAKLRAAEERAEKAEATLGAKAAG